MPNRLWIARNVHDAIVVESARKAPNETGGLLLGYFEKINRAPVVTKMVGPGPNATHDPEWFEPDYAYHCKELARLYEQSGRQLQYLGDWHSHPIYSPSLSRLDLMTCRQIAMRKSARAPKPVMFLLTNQENWESFAWQYSRQRKWLWFRDRVHELCRAIVKSCG